ncbi:hypothetical protein [Sphingomicrobium astaxanthinifaciens]|uniref:hypothetical protein n=1 Tax=Sphingomicrobium astaxanthinifaciens TaxID=1227949 RepID=UPI001FCB6E12|nr:hypothetical protein [Sphingomicrobium astaxanthinifaciens]MCJ7422312.1 hypothetical protein [Sphingomicrobium astaxanthinifaciens]
MLRLIPHPDHPPRAATGVEVAIAADGERVALTYRLHGDLSRLRLPGLGRLRREDRLWRSTCFELFLRQGPVGYREYNFAPDGRWSAYRFASYRRARSNLAQRCLIETRREEGLYILSAHVLGQRVAGHEIGLSTIVEEEDGRMSYWAVAHPPGAADFHHDDCFALRGDDL